MSIVYSNTNGWYISHVAYLRSNYETHLSESALSSLEGLFKINIPYTNHINEEEIPQRKSKKRKILLNNVDHVSIVDEIDYIKKSSVKFLHELLEKEYLRGNLNQQVSNDNNETAQKTAELMYRIYKNPSCNFSGRNENSTCVIVSCHGNTCIFPPKCTFFNCDIASIKQNPLQGVEKFNLVLMDPPWWNKYIRRKRKKCEAESYKMMYNSELCLFPLQDYLDEDGLLAVWCTNAPSHIKELREKIFPAWNLEFLTTWYWLKITVNGETVCPFSEPNKKQPYERILFACRAGFDKKKFNLPDKKLIVSIPSAIHSHKPPLTDILQNYLPADSKCLELFARYLLPGWTSVGNEVLKFQCFPDVKKK